MEIGRWIVRWDVRNVRSLCCEFVTTILTTITTRIQRVQPSGNRDFACQTQLYPLQFNHVNKLCQLTQSLTMSLKQTKDNLGRFVHVNPERFLASSKDSRMPPSELCKWSWSKGHELHHRSQISEHATSIITRHMGKNSSKRHRKPWYPQIRQVSNFQGFSSVASFLVARTIAAPVAASSCCFRVASSRVWTGSAKGLQEILEHWNPYTLWKLS